jgi:hypothetical protein
MLKAIFNWFRQPDPKSLAPAVQPETAPYKVEATVPVVPIMEPAPAPAPAPVVAKPADSKPARAKPAPKPATRASSNKGSSQGSKACASQKSKLKTPRLFSKPYYKYTL